MSWELASDPLFRLPFLAGLLVAGALPVLGVVLMLREEWLAALGIAHLAAAGALVGLGLAVPAVLGATLGALAGGALKWLLGGRGNAAYGLMILAGWSATLLIAANSPAGDALGHAAIDGQLYFAGWGELSAALLTAALTLVALPRALPLLLRARLFPAYERANRLPAWRWHLGFDLLAALGLGAGTATLGLMGVFALVLVPAWAAFRVAPSWAWTLGLAGLLGIVAYLGAFALALGLDQPFGPVLVAVCLLVGGAVGGAAVGKGAGAGARTGRAE